MNTPSRSRGRFLAAIPASILILALGLVTDAQAYRVLELLEDAYELSLDQISLPLSETGTISVRPCDGCNAVFLRVTAATRYRSNGELMELSDFVAAVDELLSLNGDAEHAFVYVFINIESKRVTRIELD